MEAIKFLKESIRMCASYLNNCSACDMSGKTCDIYSPQCNLEEYVAVVEKWSKEHPHKTRQSEFMKQFPNVEYDAREGLIELCPKRLDTTFEPEKGCMSLSCRDCKSEYWLQEVEE